MKRALVTGATGDIGSALTQYLIEHKVQVIGTYLSHPVKEPLGANVSYVQLDITNQQSVANCVEYVQTNYGGVDFLVNNAGIKQDGALDTLGWNDFEKVISTNLIGTIALTRAFLHLIKESRGRIVTVASLSGEIGNNQQSNYSASKAGLIGFTKALARDMAKYGVSVNAVSPGLIESRMVSSIPLPLQERMLSMIPQKRFGSPRSVAELVYFLLTNEENYITGQSIKIDGGLSM